MLEKLIVLSAAMIMGACSADSSDPESTLGTKPAEGTAMPKPEGQEMVEGEELYVDDFGSYVDN